MKILYSLKPEPVRDKVIFLRLGSRRTYIAFSMNLTEHFENVGNSLDRILHFLYIVYDDVRNNSFRNSSFSV